MTRSILRAAVAGLGAAFLIAAVAAALLVAPPAGLPLAFWGVVLLAGVAFERWRYKPIQPIAGPGFEPTAERFVDPTSGRPVRVFANRQTGERRYVEG